MKKVVEVLSDQQSLIERSLFVILEKIQTAIAQRDLCAIALAGGSTPKPIYEALATQNLPWEKIHVFWGDERYVPQDHPNSNQNMTRQAWLNKVNIPAANIHPMPTSAADPTADAAKHDTELREFFALQPGDCPIFDLILLGMGDDGHTASLFPQTEALSVSDRLITVGNKDGEPRLSFTVPLINHARCVIFIVAGANKRPALKQVFAPEASDLTYPARLIAPTGELWWLLDESAGAELKN